MHTHSQIPQIYSLARTVAILMLCIVAIAAIACGDSDEPEATVEVQAAPTTASTATTVPVVEVKSDEEHDSDDSTSGSSEDAEPADGDEDGEHSSASSSDATDDDEDSASSREDNDVVSNTNQITGGDSFDWSPNQALKDAEPLNVVDWTQRPTLSLGALDASGVVKEGATLFNPMFGEGATFAIYHVNYDDEPMIVLLPNLGPMSIWETDLTVAEMDHEFEGANFTFTAYSPLFFDATPSDIQLRVSTASTATATPRSWQSAKSDLAITKTKRHPAPAHRPKIPNPRTATKTANIPPHPPQTPLKTILKKPKAAMTTT